MYLKVERVEVVFEGDELYIIASALRDQLAKEAESAQKNNTLESFFKGHRQTIEMFKRFTFVSGYAGIYEQAEYDWKKIFAEKVPQ